MTNRSIGSLIVFLCAAASTPAAARAQFLSHPDTLETKPGSGPGDDRSQPVESASSPAAAVIVVADEDGFKLQAADGSFVLRLQGDVQADGRFFVDDPEEFGTSTLFIRRARPTVQGTVFGRYDFMVRANFGEGRAELQDAYIDTRLFPALGVRVGKFKAPVGLERLQSVTSLAFTEPALPSGLVPNRDIGVQLHGTLGDGAADYAFGVFNGGPDGTSEDIDSDDGKDFAARLFVHPFHRVEVAALRAIGIGIAATLGTQDGDASLPNLPDFRTSGRQTFFRYRDVGEEPVLADGRRTRISPQASSYVGPFGLLGEYVRSSQAVRSGDAAEVLVHRAWQATAMYVVTGEHATYGRLRPASPFDPEHGRWGALELVGRVHRLSVDRDAFPRFADPAVSARSATAWGVGLNWYLNAGVRFMIDLEQTHFGAAGDAIRRPTERLLLSRFQIAF